MPEYSQPIMGWQRAQPLDRPGFCHNLPFAQRTVMPRVAIVQFDDRPSENLGPLNALVARNALYARMHGYTHEFSRHLERDVPVYWNKIFLVDRFLNAGYDIVAWLDSDAVIHDFSVPIETLFEKDESFVFASDLPIYTQISPINAGVFFIKGDFGRALMREWLALYPAQLWKKIDGKWNYQDHAWAGAAYEQGSFAETLLPKYAGTPAFRQLSWKKLQSPYPQKDSFTLHFPNKLRMNCLLYLNQLKETDPLGSGVPLYRSP
jgi:hypothetical protein